VIIDAGALPHGLTDQLAGVAAVFLCIVCHTKCVQVAKRSQYGVYDGCT
jgi:hypothetical protein